MTSHPYQPPSRFRDCSTKSDSPGKRPSYPLMTLLVSLIIVSISKPLLGNERQPVAKQKFDEGVALVAEDDYEQALTAFQASYEASPRTMVLFNIAMCQKALSRLPEALLTFRKYLAEAGPFPKPDLRDQASIAITDIESSVSYLAIHADAPGATLTIDETVTLTLPLETPHPVLPGSHNIVVSAPGHEAFEFEIQTTEKETASIEVSLAPFGGVLRVTCSAEHGAEVFIDGIRVGACPYEGRFPKGEHHLEVKQHGQPTYSEWFGLEDGKRLELRIPEMPDPVLRSKPASPGRGSTNPGLMEEPPLVHDPPLRWRIMGWSAVALGAGALAVGIAFTVKGARDTKRAKALFKSYNDIPKEDVFLNYEEYRTDTIPRDQAWTVAGYAAGAILLGTAAVMLLYDAKLRRPRDSAEDSPRLSFSGGDLSIRF